ncbi:hypothetical protein CDL15_Pgr020817 [Punica granatum]|nr:hypothetical protein CDL15_Pgr020817 [Punica granatum]
MGTTVKHSASRSWGRDHWHLSNGSSPHAGPSSARAEVGSCRVEANLDHIITDVVPDTISRLLCQAREGGEEVTNPEALHTCPICPNNMTGDCKLVETCCKHVFHIPCIVQWLKMSCTCPICRYRLEDNIGSSESC